jgi:hypothetical protein
MRLQVPVKDPRAMCLREALSDLGSNGVNVFNRKRPAIDLLAESLAFHELEGEKENSFGFLHRMKGDDVRVIQSRDRPRLAIEPVPPLGIRGEIGRKHLEGDVAFPASRG